MFKLKKYLAPSLLTLFLFLQLNSKQPSQLKVNKENKHKILNTLTSPFRIAYSLLSDNFHIVDPGNLYRSKQLSSKRLASYIKKYGIKTIINLRGEHAQKKWWRKELAISEKHNVLLYNIPMTAKKLTEKEKLQELLSIYKNAPRPILIHCQGGADRTGEAAAIWKLEHQNASKQEALKQLQRCYGHNKWSYPAKRFLITIWEGEHWLQHYYCPEKYRVK